MTDLSVRISTVNGTGSLSCHHILLKSLFRQGFYVSGKNIFPSNIAGLPTSFEIRISQKPYFSRRETHDLVLCANTQTLSEDLNSLKSYNRDDILPKDQQDQKSIFLYSSKVPYEKEKQEEHLEKENDFLGFKIPVDTLIKEIKTSPSMKKYLKNIIQLGALAKILSVDLKILKIVLKENFHQDFFETNEKALDLGITWASDIQPWFSLPMNPKSRKQLENKILTDGNKAAALGSVYSGCSLLSWYPITPSSSLAESFESFVSKLRQKGTYSVFQAEDEISAFSVALGAQWAGTRAMTSTSGPGISLMSEASGYSYFAEIPMVLWDVQRMGPSTGLPTRTSQADVLVASSLSHGDTEHILLFPSTPKECFDMAVEAFDLADKFQTLVIVLSDLDLGMNLQVTDEFKYPENNFNRGKVLTAEDLDKRLGFSRYEEDEDSDGVCPRTLPGTSHPLAGYFTRGTGHTPQATYSENPDNYKQKLNRLKKKISLSVSSLPQALIEQDKKVKVAIMAYGSSCQVIEELRSKLENEVHMKTNYLQIRSFPLGEEVESFLKSHDKVFLIEQNRDAQMLSLIKNKWAESSSVIDSILQFDGLSLSCEYVFKKIKEKL